MPTVFAAPAAFRPASLSLRRADTLAEVRSVYSGREARLDFGGQWWLCDVTTERLTWDDAAEVEAWADRLRGDDAVGAFRLDLIMPRRGSTTASTMTANGAASAGAASLAVAGLGAGATLLAGSLFSDSAGRLFRVTADATADGAGQATLAIFPRLRAAVAGGATFRLAGDPGVLGRWRLAAPSEGHEWSRPSHGVRVGPKTLSFVEAFV